MAEPQDSITTFSGRRCTRTRREGPPASISFNTTAAISSPPAIATSAIAEPPALAAPSSILDPPPAPAPAPAPASSSSSLSSLAPQPTDQIPAPSSQAVPPVANPPVQASQPKDGQSSSTSLAESPTTNQPAPGPTAVQPSNQNPQVPAQSSSQAPGTLDSPVSIESEPSSVIVQPQAATPSVSVQVSSQTTVQDVSSVAPQAETRSLDSASSAAPTTLLIANSIEPTNRQRPQPSTTTSNTRIITSISASESGQTAIGDLSHSSPGSSNDDGSPPMSPGPIAGGVVAGIVGIALIAGLFFLCFRRRKQGKNALPWRNEASEKGIRPGEAADNPRKSFGRKLAAIFGFASTSTPATAGLVGHARTESRESERSAADSNGSRWSDSTGHPPSSPRTRSMSAPPVAFRSRFNGLVAGIKTRIDKKEDSPRLDRPASPSPITESLYSTDDPFLDPIQPLRPAHLRIVNPDASSPRKPSNPVPTDARTIITTTLAAPVPFRDPFADPTGLPNTTPDYFRPSRHSRTQSLQTALHSHPPASRQPSFFPPEEGPNSFADHAYPTPRLPPKPSPIPDTHLQPAPRLNPLFTPRASGTPSVTFADSARTSMATPYLATARGVRGKSDPFDLDRPEVLGFGNVLGRKEVQDSVTRPGPGNRKSSTPGWGVVNEDGDGKRVSGGEARVGMAR